MQHSITEIRKKQNVISYHSQTRSCALLGSKVCCSDDFSELREMTFIPEEPSKYEMFHWVSGPDVLFGEGGGDKLGAQIAFKLHRHIALSVLISEFAFKFSLFILAFEISVFESERSFDSEHAYFEY